MIKRKIENSQDKGERVQVNTLTRYLVPLLLDRWNEREQDEDERPPPQWEGPLEATPTPLSTTDSHDTHTHIHT